MCSCETKERFRHVVSSAVCVGVLAQLTAWSNDAGAPLWQAKSPHGADVYLLGSIHFAKPEILPLSDTVMSAFRQANAVVFEVDLRETTSPEGATVIWQASSYMGNDNLEDHVSENTMEKLINAASNYDYTKASLMHRRPWYCANMLTIAALRRAGFSPDLGIDRHLLNQAVQEEKQIIGLETTADQMTLFTEMPDEEQEKYLLQALADLNEVEHFAPELLEAWRKGDEAVLNTLVLQGIREIPAVYQKFFHDRNRRWCEKIVELAAADTSLFIVVGTGHLVGEGNLRELLVHKGFRAAK